MHGNGHVLGGAEKRLTCFPDGTHDSGVAGLTEAPVADRNRPRHRVFRATATL